MGTVTVWLLISVGTTAYQFAQPTVLVDRFAEAKECERVAQTVQEIYPNRPSRLHCIQATVLRP